MNEPIEQRLRYLDAIVEMVKEIDPNVTEYGVMIYIARYLAKAKKGKSERIRRIVAENPPSWSI